MKKPLLLLIRDGWGINPSGEEGKVRDGNASLLARRPFHDSLEATYPWSKLSCCGMDVGLPEGQMGNSEVGHLNLGAGRIVYQDLTRIHLAIKDGSFFEKKTLANLFKKLRTGGNRLHLIGLVSDGGVHSHQEHLYALLQMARQHGLGDVYIHVITDGRDTSPTAGVEYVDALRQKTQEIGVGRIATLIGRYYAMDRDQRWERTKKAYDLMVDAVGQYGHDPVATLKTSYHAECTDEFVQPFCFIEEGGPLVREGDGILFFNFRADRARQLSRAFLEKDFSGFDRGKQIPVEYVTMTQYDARYEELGAQVVFEPESMQQLLAEVLSSHGLTQCRAAETEKYPHVTYFFNGGNETPYPGEERYLVPSPKVATYDLKPQMSALELTQTVLAQLEKGTFDFFVVNFANPDMVGHTGVLEAAIKAVEVVDTCMEAIVKKALSMNGICLITSDHGNCEQMLTADGKPYTAHTTNLVSFMYVAENYAQVKMRDGILADVAPTILSLLRLPQPSEMTGKNLIQFQ